MSSAKTQEAGNSSRGGRPNWPSLAAAAVIVAAAAAAYHNSFSGPLVLDDAPAIEQNLSIRSLWPIWRVLSPPARRTVTGRPILNLSLAVNYAISGKEVWSYHVLNLVIHILAALTLFGVVRRTLLLPGLRERFERSAVFLAMAVALIWAVHPLQTESVTYIIQRAESIVGLFYLLTLYCVIRGAAAARSNIWYILAVFACLLGMASKEVMVSAPLIVLFYDRAFLAGSFKEALRKRWGAYAGLAATWGLLAYLIIGAGGRGGSVGFAGPVTAWSYLRAQFGWIIHYLRLSIWPHPLVLFYGDRTDPAGMIDWLYAALVVGLLAGTLWAIWRRPKLGFVGAFFFAVLAPTSSFVPVQTQVAAEHRMYLALAAVVALAVAGCWQLWRRWAPAPGKGGRLRPGNVIPAAVLVIVAAALGTRTVIRNEDYRSGLTIWQGVVEHRPDTPAGYYSLGLEWDKQGNVDKAVELYLQALRLRPLYADAHIGLGVAFTGRGELDKSVPHLELAVRIDPAKPEAHFNLAVALERKGELERAIGHYRESLRLAPWESHKVNFCLAGAFAAQGRLDQAVMHYELAVQEEPNNAETHCRLGEVLAKTGKFNAAAGHLREALAIKPDYARANCNLGIVLLGLGKDREALKHLEKALRIRPDYAQAHTHVGVILAMRGQTEEAIRRLEKAISLDPEYHVAYYNLGSALARQGKMEEAREHFQEAVRLRPKDHDARCKLAMTLRALGRFDEAAAEYEKTLEYESDHVEAANGLAWLLATYEPLTWRDPKRAVQLATRACELTGWSRIDCLDVLATAHANAGQFEQAVTMAEKAAEMAKSVGMPEVAREIEGRLNLYRSGRPYRLGIASVPGQR